MTRRVQCQLCHNILAKRLAEKDAVIAEKDAVIAEQKAELATLRAYVAKG